VALTKVYNPRVVQLAAVFAVILGFSPLVADIIYSIPESIIGGASFMLYGMIAAVGIRNLVDHRIDLSKSKNLIIVAVMLVTGLGMRFAPAALLTFTMPTGRLGLAIAVVLSVLLNIILPDGKKEEKA
jgi:uracil permease